MREGEARKIEEEPLPPGTERGTEAREANFETAKREVLDFLNTPFHAFRKKIKEKGGVDDWQKALLDELERRFGVLTKSGPAEKVRKFLKELLINDRADASNRPSLFSQTYEEALEFDPEVEIEGYYPDVFDGRSNHDFDTGTTYRTDYYKAIVEALSNFGKEAEGDLIDCLKEIDAFVLIDFDAIEEGRYLKVDKKHRTPQLGRFWDEKTEIEQINEGLVGINPAEEVHYGYRGLGQLRGAEISIIKTLSKIDPAEDTINYLVSRIGSETYGFRLSFNEHLNIFNKKPDLAGKHLMNLLHKEKNPYPKAVIKQTLYHLELGKIGMSEEGVNYLGKIYDLGQNNDPDHFAHRITDDGKIALFDENNRALGYFQLHGLDSPEKKLKAEMLQFTYETLFRPKKDETPEERAERLKILEEFREKYFETYLVDFYKETGLRLNNLNFAEQGWFLWYVNNASEENKKRAKQFIAKHGELGFKTFLSLEHDRQNGDRILAIGENLDTPSAEAVFKKYSAIVNQSEKVRLYLRQIFGARKDYSEETVNLVIENILQRGKDLLVNFANQFETAKRQKKTISGKQVLKQLEDIKTEILLFASTFKAVSSEQKIDFRDVVGTELKTADSSELTAEDKKEMERIFVGNRTAYSKKLLATTRQEFDEAMDTPGKKFYLLTHEGNLVSFLRFDQLPNGNLYLGSVNVRPEVRGSAIGTAMLKAAIDQEAGGRNLEAIVYEKNPMLKHYLKDFGFKVVGEIPDYHGTGQKFLKIERPAARKATKKRQPAVEQAAAA